MASPNLPAANLSAHHILEYQESARQQDHENYAQQIEIAVDKTLDHRAELSDECRHQEKARRAAQDAGHHKYPEIDLEHPGADRDQFIGNRRESGGNAPLCSGYF